MGKSLNGKELGRGITQRKDGRYQGRFVNRFGELQIVYARTLNEVRQQLRKEQYEDENALNVVNKDMTLDEWYQIWMDTCKKNCRASTKTTYTTIPLTEKAYQALKKQRIQKQEILLKGYRAQDEYKDLVFITRYNKPTQQFIIQECIEVVLKRIRKEYPDYERFSPHCFRHTFATRAIENGMQPKTLQKILGHGSLQMTMDLYCHVTEETLIDAMQLMEKKCV